VTSVRLRGAAAAALVALAVMATVGALPAGAAGERAGAAVVVRDAGSISLELPSGASCPGDSANDGYRVQSFVVPAKDDPGALSYYSVMPVGEGRYALYDIYTNPFIQAQTAKQTRPGGPGPIIDIPAFNFAVFPAGKLPPGRYHIGIACSLHNDTVRYWDVDLQLTAAPSDRPAQVQWRVVGTHPSSGTNWLPWLLGAAAVVAAGFAVWSWRSSRSPKSEPRQEAT
jgi:hypothetical protein